MANPQLENGYTKIANDILEALIRTPLKPSEAQCIHFLFRKTYGWGKTKDFISISEFENGTGLCRRAIIYALQNLEAKRMIEIKRYRGRGRINEINEVKFQKNYDKWVVQGNSEQYNKMLKKQREVYAKKMTGVVQRKKLAQKGTKSGRGSAKNGQKVVQNLAPTKENTKERKKPISFEGKSAFFKTPVKDHTERIALLKKQAQDLINGAEK